ncbi:MAG: sel1 repeat family protein [Methylococcaceae bacterium]|nr:sel1 repeat family protein [Methylococcaceae bacterium]
MKLFLLFLRFIGTMVFLFVVVPSVYADIPNECDKLASFNEDNDRIYQNATPTTKIEPEKALPACRKAVSIQPSNPRYQYQLGRVLSRDHQSEALVWFEKAANQGYAAAQVQMGMLYKTGLYVEQNRDVADSWFTKAANKGDRYAQYRLARQFIPRDLNKASNLLESSAKQGYGSAQNDLCNFFQEGIGVIPDIDKAKYWCQKAMLKGFKDAETAYYRLKKGYLTESEESEKNKKEVQALAGDKYACDGNTITWEPKEYTGCTSIYTGLPYDPGRKPKSSNIPKSNYPNGFIPNASMEDHYAQLLPISNVCSDPSEKEKFKSLNQLDLLLRFGWETSSSVLVENICEMSDAYTLYGISPSDTEKTNNRNIIVFSFKNSKECDFTAVFEKASSSGGHLTIDENTKCLKYAKNHSSGTVGNAPPAQRNHNIGDKVCISGKYGGVGGAVLFVFGGGANEYEMCGYVEGRNNSKIQIRLSKVMIMGNRYNDEDVYVDKIIWDWNDNWK